MGFLMKQRRPSLWTALIAGVWAFFMLIESSPLTLPALGTAQTPNHAQAHAIYDVKAFFGAVGNGVADDTTEVQDAIDAANVDGGGTVWLPGPATYLCGQLALKSNVVIDGPRSAVLKLKSGSNSNQILAATRDACGVQHITLDGNKAGQSAGAWSGIEFNATTKFVVRSVYFKNHEMDGIYVGYTSTPSSDGVITDNHITGVDRNAISVTSGQRIAITNNIIDNCGLYGIDVEVNNPTDYARDITISGNTIAICAAGIGVICGSSNNGSVAVTGNTIRQIADASYGHGIILSSATPGCTVTGNTISDVTLNGIKLQNNSHGAVVSSNSIDDAAVDGIYLDTANDASVTGNTIRGSGEYGIRLVGGRQTVSGNSIFFTAGLGIYVTNGGTQYSITGNTIVFTGAGLIGIRIDGASRSTVAGNSVSATALNGYGLYLGAGSETTIVIVGNQFSNMLSALELNSTAGNLVGLNEMSTCTTGVASAGTNRFLATQHVAAATPTGGVSGDIKVGNGKIWINDAGTWKSVAIA